MASLSDIERFGFLADDIKSFLATYDIHINCEEDPESQSDTPPIETGIDPLDLPDELDAANMAFRAVTNGYGDPLATFKNRLIGYLENNFPDLSDDAVKRIATVANPNKAPGRKKSNAE